MLTREKKFTLPQGMTPTLFVGLHSAGEEFEISDVVDVSSGTPGSVSFMSFSLWIWFFCLFLVDGYGSIWQEILPFFQRLCLPCLFLDDGGLAV